MASQHKRKSATRRRPLCGAILLAMASLANAQNLPTGETGLSGASVVRDGNTMTINQTTRGARLNWDTFSIGVGHSVRFVQPDANSIALNRVLGDQASSIQGALEANGRVFLINPNGVLFGSTAVVDVGGLVASTLDISDEDFQQGLESGSFDFAIDGGTAADITNLGNLTARAGGTLAMLGGVVDNSGSMVADNGTVALASSTRVTLDFFGDGLTQVSIGTGSDDGGILNSGLLQADGGSVQLRTDTDDGEPEESSGYLRHSGIIRARTLGERNGRIVLDAGSGTLAVGVDATANVVEPGITGAVLDARGTGARQRGGTIEMRGNNITVFGASPTGGDACADAACTLIDASGHSGGGSISMVSDDYTTIFSVNIEANSPPGVEIRSDALVSGRGGTIDLANVGGIVGGGASAAVGGIQVFGSALFSARGAGAAGGRIRWSSEDGNIGISSLVQSLRAEARLDVSGTSGGSVEIDAGRALAFHGDASIRADAIGRGNGGRIRLFGRTVLRAHGDLSAHGAGSGNGGFIETSGGSFDLRGIGIDARAGDAGGTAGEWLVDPYDLSIVHGNASGTLPTNPYEALSNSIIQDGDINAALDNGSSVSIGTGAAAVGNPNDGDIVFDGSLGRVEIRRSIGTGELTFRLDANRRILANQGLTIDAGDGALNVLFNSDANATGFVGSNDGAITLFDADITTNGGAFWLFGRGNASSGSAGPISLYQSIVDTRGAGSTSGEVRMRGYGGSLGVGLFGTTILGGAGGIGLSGRIRSSGDGVYVGSDQGVSSLVSSQGDVSMSGIVDIGVSSGATLRGVAIEGATVVSEGGNVDITGRVARTPTYLNRSMAVYIGEDGQVGDSGTSRVRIVGESAINGTQAGIDLGSADGCGISGGACVIGQDVILQASVSGGPTAIDFNGRVLASRVVNLRPGGVDATGTPYERTGDTISLGGGTGFTLGQDLFEFIDAPEVVIGSDAHTGLIQVLSAFGRAGNLTLQSGGTGAAGIRLDGAVDVGGNTLGLLSEGDITQGAAGSITAESLLVESGGDVQLGGTANDVGGNTLAGSASGNFNFVDVNALTVGSVSAVGFDAGSNSAQSFGGNGVQAGGDVFIRTLSGNLTLGSGIGAGNDIELVTAGTLQNTGAVTLSAGGAWTVWASTWTGETRGGLAGSGTLPNLYGCSFQGNCVVSVPSTGNRFIYRDRPVAVVDIDDATRAYGADNPAFFFTVNGLILGDQALNAISGSVSTNATQASDTGQYAISGSFGSPAGYLVIVVPGLLNITQAVLIYVADPYSRYVGLPNGPLTGTLTGFRNGDTVATATTGSLSFTTTADVLSPVGTYAINGTGLSAGNYVFEQAPGNATALEVLGRITPVTTLDQVRDPLNNYLYDRNLGATPMCMASTDLVRGGQDEEGDVLAREWAKVKTRPNLTNCVPSNRRNGCDDF